MCKMNPRVDFAFKKLFGVEENKDILISLINAIVSNEDQVTDLTLLNPYNAKNFKSDKLSILDIKAKDRSGKYYLIEMQITDQEFFDRRALYYWSRVYTGQLSEGVNYDMLTKTIGINILNFNCLEEVNYHNCYKLINIESKQPFLNHVEIHFIELDKAPLEMDSLKTSLDRWVNFLALAGEYNSKDLPTPLKKIKSIEKAISVLDAIGLTTDEREAYEARLKWLRDEDMALQTAEKRGEIKGLKRGLEEGMEKGIEKGIEEGMEKGIEEGMEKGIEKGIEEGMEKGIEEGMEKGIEKGIEEGMEKGIKDALNKMIDAGISRVDALEILKIKE